MYKKYLQFALPLLNVVEGNVNVLCALIDQLHMSMTERTSAHILTTQANIET